MKMTRVPLFRFMSISFATALLALTASAQTTLTATLTGANERPSPGDPDGSGFAVVDIDADAGTVRYVITSRDIVAPSMAHIHAGTSDVAGGVEVNFQPEFEDGVASGTVSADPELLAEILADPAAFYVNVHNAEYPAGAIRGQLTATNEEMTSGIFPVAGSVEGANQTFFRTDLSLLNRSDVDTVVVLEFFGAAGTGTAPTAVATIPLAANQHIYLFEVTQDTFDLEAGSTGAIRVLSPRPIVAVARIYNDQRSVDGGTFGQFVRAQESESNRSSGALPMLSNAHPATLMGFRTNIGWFNAGDEPVTVAFRARNDDGSVIETTSLVVEPRQQRQMTLTQLFPSIQPMDSAYVTFETSDEAPLYVYASVVDNRNGDAVFIPAE